MFCSRLGKAMSIGALAFAAPPAPAMEPAPLDSAALSEVTALGAGGIAPLASLPEPGDGMGIPPAAGIGVDGPAETDRGLVRTVLQPDPATTPLAHRDDRGTVLRIVQTATIDLPVAAGSQTAVGAIMQSGGDDLARAGQSATNLAVAATLNGAGSFAAIRP